MSKLKDQIIEAHGGMDRWKRYRQVRASLSQGGALWALKGQGGVLDETTVTVSLTDQQASHSPFGMSDRHSLFTPQRVAIIGSGGTVEQELENPRASFADHSLETPWSELQLAYFAGIAMWTYLNMPFLLDWDGVETDEIGGWEERGETWQRLLIRFPSSIPTHSSVQTLYVGDDGLLRRHDYDVEIAGNTPGAHYVSDYVEVGGLQFPTRRRIYPRQPDGHPMAEPLVVSIDLDAIELS
ncbi:hypothetical protein [Sphingomonas sp. S2-65]|uniref:hypothetical protein n=1 Tax=Sphingomonas sp. S2-65 TaxID=2903960 RepID=UPI001F1AFA73|nr:hypothetical protein [Sphingomonas sp. S2-65]UYY58102.1 hypothetical protein LZ586_15765 [Sphingomonas sp. S2-65]